MCRSSYLLGVRRISWSEGLETQAIDAYNDAHHYRAENPLAHLHEDEAPVESLRQRYFRQGIAKHRGMSVMTSREIVDTCCSCVNVFIAFFVWLCIQ